MAQPTTASPLNNPSHSTLHNFHVNVKMFGAVGDGVADDTTAITNALAALPSAATAQGGELFFPPGTYKFTSALVLNRSNIRLVGPGATLTRSGGSVLSLGSANNTDIRIEDIQFYNSTNAVSFDGPNIIGRITFDRCQFYANATAIRVAAAGQLIGARFRDCLFLENTGDVFTRLSENYFNNISFEDCWWQGSTHVTYYKDATTTGGFSGDTLFLRNTFEGPASANFLATHRIGNAPRVVFESCHWADFSDISTNKPLITTGTSVNEFPTEVILTGCSIYNANGPCFYADPPTATVRYTVINSLITSKSGGGGPFGGGNAYFGVTLIGCDIPVAQTSWNSGSEVLYINCREGGVTIPHKMVGTASASGIDLSGGSGLYVQFKENGTTDAAAGVANTGRLYVKDNGSGKTQLCVRFNTGAVQVLATEP